MEDFVEICMNNKFTEIFLELFENKNISQRFLSNEIGINQSQISRILNGKIPKTNTAVKIADFFGCSLDYLIGISNTYQYKNQKAGFKSSNFYPEYQMLLKQNNTTHYALAKKHLVCETSLRLWKNGSLPSFETLCNIAIELGGSVDKMLGKA